MEEYLIRVNYNSGIQEEFWCKSFSIENGSWEWKSCEPERPILMNVDNVESVWQLDTRKGK